MDKLEIKQGSFVQQTLYVIPVGIDAVRVFNKIVLNRLNWNLKWLHDKWGGGGQNYFFAYIQNGAFWGILR
jgi:hypothetical protein